MKFRTEGLIIKEQNIGEQDKLVFALTKSNGVIKAFVRGAKNIKNQKCASTSLLSYSRLTIYKGRDSYIIGDAQTIRIFSKLRSDVKKMCLAQYFCELALTICPREQKAEPFLSLILNSLYLLGEEKRSAELIKPCFEMRLASMAGYMPDLRMCRECGEYCPDTMYFLPKLGMLECAACHVKNGEIAVELNPSTLTALRHTVYADDDKLFSFSLSEQGLEVLNQASESYLKYRFEKDFKTLTLYKMIS
ncbi:DNA repair protein RecO [uncultured Ruminococcus sp.]|uniref:DNA repair protein RecO n=1 Tax=uncultured Ruminococcus sp. TaxID=165186 RepID=UPI0025EA2CF4|nr:DNA repair protein RecO [uncultured Ruminococcus sp.]